MRRPRGQGHTASVCQQCGNSFRHPARFAQRFCSPECRYAAQRTGATNWLGTFTCAVCGSDFRAARTLKRVTCSKACQYKLQSTGRDPSKSATTACPTCSKEFSFHKSWPRIYCSNVCAGKANVRNIKHFDATGFDAVCESCETTFRANAATRGRFCSRQCFGRWLSATKVGSANPKWKGGHPYGPTWPAARDAARGRDKVCQDCGMTPETNGKALDVHHIRPFHTYGLRNHAAANALDNLVALCAKCHIEREWSTNWIVSGKKPFGHNHVPRAATAAVP